MPGRHARGAPSPSSHHGIPRLEIRSREAYVFYTDVETVTAPEVLTACHAVLSEEERDRQRAFHFSADRHLFLVAHALLRNSLSHYASVAPQAWRFDVGPQGRPEISKSQRAVTDLRFNLSHARQLAACVIARHVDVGIDVECLDRKVDIVSIADRYFAPSESAQLARLTGHDQELRFLEYWTLKEAYVKAQGGGLSIPLDAFHFQQDEHRQWRIGFSDSSERPDRWQFRCLRPTPKHVMSIAIHRGDQPDFDLAISESAPVQ